MFTFRPAFAGWLFLAAFFHSVAAADAYETFGAKLRRLASTAEISNSLKNPPLRPAAAWTANKAYEPGEAVQNGQNVYLCHFAGISAASGGPTGVSYGDIKDGTATWVYLGPAIVNTTDPAAPKMTSVTSPVSLGLTKTFNPISNKANFSLGGGVPTPDPSAPTAFVSFPAVHAYPNGKVGNAGRDGVNNYHWSASFVTDAPVVAIRVSWGAQAANIIIDGRKLSPGGVRGLPGWSWFVLDFTKAGGRKFRTITLEEFGNIKFGGVSVDPASAVLAPSASDRVRAAFFGSSIECGGNGFPLYGNPSWPVQTSKLLGWSDPWNLGVGGAGYINNLQGAAFNYEGHIQDATLTSPDIVVVAGPINDGSYGASAITSAAVSLFRKLRAALPSVPIIAMGTFPGSYGPNAIVTNSESAIQTAVAQLNDRNIYFIPLISGQNGAVIYGTGKVTAPTGGNSDFYIMSDSVHPTQLGIDYVAAQFAARIKTIFVNKAL